MIEEDCIQRSIAEHVLWCCEERDRLAGELVLYRSGALAVGRSTIGEIVSYGTMTRVAFLHHTIEQLDRVISAYALPFPELY